MASTSAAPDSRVLDEIKKLFSWNPPSLVPDPNKKPSTTSRLPGFYDKHFAPEHVLQRVERLPSLIQDLARNVDKALSDALPTLPPLGNRFITAQRRELDREEYERVAKNEKAVANFYDQYAAKYCLSVASTLALHPTASFSNWSSLLCWTQSISSSGYGIMDGELRFKQDLGVEQDIKSHRAAIVATMEDNVRRIFEVMRDSGSGLGSWKIKGLGAGPGEVMSAVPNLGTFAWTYCTATNCTNVRKHQKERKKVKVIGPDARDPPWILPPTAKKEENKRKRDDGSPPHNAKKHKRDYDDNEEEQEQEQENYHGDVEEEEQEHQEEYNDDDEAYQDRHDVTAQNLVQQAWAQATRVDSTVIVLHSGNHELVCVRHRASQTLYVSEVIEPHVCVEPGYGKLQVGIYVAAIQDTMDRKRQQPPPPVSQPSPAGDGSTLNQDNTQGSGSGHKGGSGHWGNPKGGRTMERSGGLQGSAGGKGPTDHRLAIDFSLDDADLLNSGRQQNMIHAANECDVLHVYLQYDIYDSPTPAMFLRSAPLVVHTRCPTPPLSPPTIRSYKPEECMSIVLSSEIGQGATGVVHRGTLTPEIWDSAMQMDVVVKLAFNALRSEYEVYRHLRLKGVHRGITTALGFFDDSEGSGCALVMLYAGVPLSTDSQSNLSISERKSALSMLESIHCAGILHADIRLENILISDLGITIIDFGHARHCDDKRAKDEELAQLRYFLGLGGESR